MAESNVKLRVDARDAVNALQQTNRASEKLNNTLGRTEKRAATATGNIQRMGVSFRTTAASIVAITGAVTFLSRSLNVLGERQADAAALANGLQKLGRGEAELKRLQKAADELGKATLFNQEDFDAGFALLTSFTSIGVNSFERVAEAAADVAQITGQDVKSSLLQLAKALQDPVRGLTALSRSGTTFTDQQKKQIKALVESGKQLEAQDLILREIETQYGNAARAAGSAGYAGAVDSLGESFRDFQERLAQGVTPAVNGTLTALTDLFDLLNQIPEPVGQAALGIGATAAAIVALKTAAAAAIPVVKTLFAFLVANPFVALAAGITAATVALAGYRNESERIADAAVGGDAAAVQAARARLLETEQEISLKKLELEGARGQKAQQIRRELKRLRDDAEALRKSIPKVADPAAAENKITPTGGLPKPDEKKKTGKTDLERQQEAASKLLKTLEERQTLATALTSDEQKMLQLKIDQANVDEQFPLLSAETRDNIKDQLEALYAQENVTQALKDAADDRAKKEQEVADKQAEQAKKLEDLYKNVGTAIENSIVDGIMGAIDGTQTLQETVSGLLKDIGKMFLQFAVRGLLSSTGLPMFAAEGGYVSGATNAVVGEAGPEYIIPESKMRESMARYSRGARGSAVIPENGEGGTSGAGGGTAVAAPIDVRYTVERINSVDYVTADQFQSGMRQAADQGAKQGEQRALLTLRQNTSQRRRIGI
ncbi:hypothetical protein [Limnobacter sp.]|uniref:hypothetical protein n=1 Tax=Limnobacter sp. TaxID=2003368 RepID=UPI0025C37E85|nr:hypothetical protein [Limnobacter sp.]